MKTHRKYWMQIFFLRSPQKSGELPRFMTTWEGADIALNATLAFHSQKKAADFRLLFSAIARLPPTARCRIGMKPYLRDKYKRLTAWPGPALHPARDMQFRKAARKVRNAYSHLHQKSSPRTNLFHGYLGYSIPVSLPEIQPSRRFILIEELLQHQLQIAQIALLIPISMSCLGHWMLDVAVGVFHESYLLFI